MNFIALIVVCPFSSFFFRRRSESRDWVFLNSEYISVEWCFIKHFCYGWKMNGSFILIYMKMDSNGQMRISENTVKVLFLWRRLRTLYHVLKLSLGLPWAHRFACVACSPSVSRVPALEQPTAGAWNPQRAVFIKLEQKNKFIELLKRHDNAT